MNDKTKRLTTAELRVLRDDGQPDIVEFLSREGADLGLRTDAYRKVAAAARARREAILEVKALSMVEKANGITYPTREDVEAVAAENDRLRRQLEAATARDALAVHSGND